MVHMAEQFFDFAAHVPSFAIKEEGRFDGAHFFLNLFEGGDIDDAH